MTNASASYGPVAGVRNDEFWYDVAVLRRLFTLASVLSLVLCAATVVLWVRSYFVSDWLGRLNYSPGGPNEDHHLWIRASCGWLYVNWGGDPAENFSAVRWKLMHLSADGDYPTDEPPVLRAIGVGWERLHRLPTWETSATVSVRLALPALVSALVAILSAWCAVRRRQQGGMLVCAACGYDLRATPDRCPECGHVPENVVP